MRRFLYSDGWSPALVTFSLALGVVAGIIGQWLTVLAMALVITGQLLALTPDARRKREQRRRRYR